MRIAICDDGPDFTERMRTMVESGLAACGEKTDISVYQEGAAFCSSDAAYGAVFPDIDMPQMNGFDSAVCKRRAGHKFAFQTREGTFCSVCCLTECSAKRRSGKSTGFSGVSLAAQEKRIEIRSSCR